MTSSLFNYFYRVEIETVSYTLGDIKAGTTAVRDTVKKTYNFVNKRVKDAATSAERETYLPILKSVGEITLAAGEILPTASFSSITLDDSRGSFGADRRFSDILERSTIIGQTINFYLGEATIDTDAPASWKLLGSGRIASWTKALSSGSPEITIQIQPSKISDKVMNIEISRDIPGMEDAPDESISKIVPLVFNGITPYLGSVVGNTIFNGQQIPATRITTSNQDSVKYAISTQLFRTTMSAPLDYVLVKKDWNTSPLVDVIGIGVPLQITEDLDFTGTLSGTYTINQYAASAYQIPQWSLGSNKRTSGAVITSVDISMKGQGSAGRTSNAYLSVFILRVDSTTYNVIEEVGRGRVSLDNYNANNNVLNSNFSVRVSFDKPIVMELLSGDSECDFYIGFEAVGIAAGDMVINRYTIGTPYKRLVKERTAGSGDSFTDWRILPDTGGSIAYKLNPASISYNRHEELFSPDGLTYSSLTLTQVPADIGQVNPALDSLSIICLINGLCGYAYDVGSTVGIASAYIATTTLPWTQYVDGWSIEFRSHVNNFAGATLSVDGLPAWPIYENGAPIAANRFNTTFAPFPTGALTVDIANSRFNYTAYFNYEYGLKIYEVEKALNLLSYQWDGERWEDKGIFDITTLKTSHYDKLFKVGSSNHRARLLSGTLDVKTVYSQLLSEVAKGTASKIGIYSNGKLFVFPWGVLNDEAYIIPQSDIIPLSWETRDDSTIINRVQLSFEKNYINTGADTAGFRFSVDFSNVSFLSVAAITERSRSIYGAKNNLDSSLSVFGFSADELSAINQTIGLPGYLTGGPLFGSSGSASLDFLADYYISRFALPFVYCSFVVPYHRYKDIKMFDVISFHHSEFPAFFGTDPNARPGVVNDGSSVTTVPTANGGEEFVRAQSYRGLVEGISYVMAMEHAPAIRLTVQVLINGEFDPT
jgi:hypothetical protein